MGARSGSRRPECGPDSVACGEVIDGAAARRPRRVCAGYRSRPRKRKPALTGPSAVERTGIEPVASDLQIPGFEARLGQIRSVKAKLCWFDAVEIRYSGTPFGTCF